MKLELNLALKNLFGARLRTLLNVLVLSFSFVIIIFLNSIMDGWDQQAQKDSIEWEFGNGHLINENFDPLDPYTILDGHGKIPEYQTTTILKINDEELKGFRLTLSYKVASIIKSSMKLLGINVPEKM